jgi:diacylglycerol kinase family enzyme
VALTLSRPQSREAPPERAAPVARGRIVEERGVVFILNGAAGGGRADEARAAILRHAGGAGAPAQIHATRNGAEIGDLVRQAVAQGASLVVAGGGDGTVNAVASALVGSEAALGVLPLGTLNHFAKDLKIPLEIDAAVENVFSGRIAAIDVGEVNGRIFLNNSSLGLYPRIVRYREAERAQGHNKWIAFARAIVAALRRHSLFHVRLHGDGGQALSRATAFVFIGNNEYEMSGANIGARKSLEGGQLWVCLPRRGGRLDLLHLALRALVGRLRDRDLHVLKAGEIVIEMRKPRPSVATDGEVVDMAAPLTYRIRPRTLKVVVPAESGGQAAL